MSCPHDFNGTCPDCADRDRNGELARLRAENEAMVAATKTNGGLAAHLRDRYERQWRAASAERDRLAAELAARQAEGKYLADEVDCLRAVLATTRENVEALVQSVGERYITQAAVCTILAAQRARAGAPRQHADACEAESDHPQDCATATRLARLTAFAEAVRDERPCRHPDERFHCDDGCWHCDALRALDPPR